MRQKITQLHNKKEDQHQNSNNDSTDEEVPHRNQKAKRIKIKNLITEVLNKAEKS